MKVNLEYLMSPLVKHKQMQNVQHNIFGYFLMPIVLPKLPTFGWVSSILKILYCAASQFCSEELYLTYHHSGITLWALYYNRALKGSDSRKIHLAYLLILGICMYLVEVRLKSVNLCLGSVSLRSPVILLIALRNRTA